MKKFNLSLIILLCCGHFAFAQLPNCTTNPSTIIYIHNGLSIYNYDVSQPISATNPVLNTISMPPGGGEGLAVSNNLNSASPAVTFYTTSGGNYWYHNGTTWVNTGHSAGGAGAVNPGGGGNFLYNLIGGSGEVYKYDGTGPATLLLAVPGFNGGGPYDLVGNCDGSFYILSTNQGTPAPFLRQYSPAGTLVNSWPATGSSSTAGGGFAIVNNQVYYHNGGGFHNAPFVPSPGNLAFTPNTSTIPNPSDFACCPVCVSTNPVLPPVANFLISNDTICAGTCIDFTDATTNVPTSWNWTFAGAVPGTSNLQNPTSICYNSPGLYTVKLVASNTAGSDSITKTVRVEVQPTANITGDSLICLGQTVSLTGSGGASYLWLNNNATSANINVTPSLTTTYTLVVTTGICKDTTTHTINVSPQPNASISGDTELCMGESSLLSVTPAGAVYLWSHGPSAGNINVNPNTTTTYSVLVSIGNCFDTASITVNVNPLPDVVSFSTPSNCDINNGTAQAFPSLGTPPYSFSWSNGATNALNNNLAPGNYVVTLTDAKNCTASFATNVGKHPDPVAVVTPYPVAQIAVGDRIQLNASGGVQYNWLNPTRLSCSNCPSPMADPRNDITYCVNVTNEFGCMDTACTTILVDTSCAQIFIPSAFTPNGDDLNDFITIDNRCIESLRFAIFNRWGQKVYESTSLQAKWDGTYNGEAQLISAYFYVLEAKLFNGKTINKRGDITLIR